MKEDAKPDATKIEAKTAVIRNYLRLFRFLSFIVFSGIAFYWISEVWISYFAYPVNTVVTLVKNETFTMPSITICPQTIVTHYKTGSKYPKTYFIPCYNETELKMYNISNFSPFTPFYHSILSKIRYDTREEVLGLSTCSYSHNDFSDQGVYDCMKNTSGLGSWKTYQTQHAVCHTFTPTPATAFDDRVDFRIKLLPCNAMQIVIHSPNIVFEQETSPDFKPFTLGLGRSIALEVTASEFHNVKRKSSPCNNDPRYSQSKCLNKKKMKYLIKHSGCNIPEVTGMLKFEDYPACTSESEMIKFETRRAELTNLDKEYRLEIQNKAHECPEPCSKIMYKVKRYPKSYQYLVDNNLSSISFKMSTEAMPFMRATEQFTYTPDMLVSFIGGTISMFLGYSCLSLVDIIEVSYKKIMNTMRSL